MFLLAHVRPRLRECPADPISGLLPWRYFIKKTLSAITFLLCKHGFCDVSVTLYNVSVTLSPALSKYQSRSSMYIRGLIPRNFAELAEAVPIGGEYDQEIPLTHTADQRNSNRTITVIGHQKQSNHIWMIATQSDLSLSLHTNIYIKATTL